MSRQVLKLKEKLDRALRRDKLDEALALYGEIEKLEPDEPRWPHRRGDLLRRLGRDPAAIEAFGAAVDLYAKLGFLARAVAMAKVVLGIDPARTDILSRVDPEAARALHRKVRTPTVTPAIQQLTPAGDADDDELRFEDAPSIELDLSDLELADRTSLLPSIELDPDDSDVIVLPDDDLAPTAEQIAKLPGSPIFAELPQEALVDLGREAELVEAPDGAILLETGDPADSLYVIVEGAVRINVPATGSDDDATLAEGDVFGEACLLDDVTRKADVIVRGRLVALKIPKATIDRIVEAHPAFGEVTFDLFTRRVVSNLLCTSPLFFAFDPETRKEIGKLFEARRAEPGQVIVSAGKRSDALYVLMAGTATLQAESGSTRELRPVVIVGQSSLISREPLDFTVTAVSETLFLRLPAASFTQLAATYPPVLAHLAELASQRVAAVVDGAYGPSGFRD